MTIKLDDLASPELQRALTEALNSADAGDIKALLLRAQASKMLLDAGALLDEADTVEQAADLNKAADAAEQKHAAAVAEAERLATAARDLVTGERLAADKLAAAAEHARLAQERVEELALAEADPASQTQAILERDAANQVAGQFRAKAEAAAAERVTGEACLATAREVVRQAKAAAKAAKDSVDAPPPVVPSWWTVQLDGLRRASAGRDLGAQGTAEVAATVEMLAMQLGVDKIFAARARKAQEDAERQRVSGRLLPKAGAERRAGIVIPPPGTAPIAPLVTPTR